MTKKPKRDASEIQHAKSITVAVCAHGSLHINLLDASGKVFASACMDEETSFDLIEDIIAEFNAPSSPCEAVH